MYRPTVWLLSMTALCLNDLQKNDIIFQQDIASSVHSCISKSTCTEYSESDTWLLTYLTCSNLLLDLESPTAAGILAYIQGGPAKVRPTYIFAGNIILVTFECIGKIQWFFGKCDNSLDTHLGKRKNLVFNIVHQMAKNH